MKSLLILFLLTIIVPGFGQWTPNMAVPSVVAQHALVAHPNGKVYLFNGYPASGGEVSAMYVYTISSNSWSSGPSAPFALRGAGYCLGTDNNIYSCGGYAGGQSSAFFRFNPTTGAWTTLTSPPSGGWEGSIASYGNKIYYAGGESCENQLRIYDISTGLWTSGANLLTGVRQHKIVSGNNGYLYVFGGTDAANLPVNLVQRYDIANGSWTNISTIPIQKNQFGACLGPDARIYLVCGKNNYSNNAGPFFNDVNIYDICSNTWSAGSQHPMNHGELAATSYTNGIFAMGGTNGSGLNINYFLPVTPGLNLTVSSSAAQICANVTVTLTASGAGSYTWSTGVNTSSIVITPTANISYSVVGANSPTCTQSALLSLSVNPVPTVAVNNGTICSGTAFVMNPTGASTYTFSSGSSLVTPTVTTSYSITGTANGCVSSNTAVSTVSVIAQSTITVNSGTVCAGDSFTIIPSGALNYFYSGGSAVVTPLSTTSYTVTGTGAGGCVSSSAISTVAVNALPTVTVSSGSVCAGDSFTFVPGGASSYTFSGGSAVVTPTATTIYTVTGTDANGCVSLNATGTVSFYALPSVSVTSNHTLICRGGSATLTASGANTYSWSTSAATGSIVVTPTANTIYTVTGTGPGGCSSLVVITQSVSLCTGIAGVLSENIDIRFYPNPGNGILTMEFAVASEDRIVELYNYAGQLIRFQSMPDLNAVLNFEQEASGIYIIRVTEKGNAVFMSKVIKQ